MAKPYKLYAAKGGGSMIVEAAFGFTKLALAIKDVDWDDLGWESKTLLRFLELQVKGPWFLGRAVSALDVYVWVLAKWRPGTEWLQGECPKLFRIADAMGQHEVCKRVAERNAI